MKKYKIQVKICNARDYFFKDILKEILPDCRQLYPDDTYIFQQDGIPRIQAVLPRNT